MKALVLEDNQRVVQLYKKIFEQKEFEVDFVEDSFSCLDRCGQSPYDLVILERPTQIQPDENLEDKIRDANPLQKVFFLSPYLETRNEGFESLKETLDLIDKPFAMISLLSGIEVRKE